MTLAIIAAYWTICGFATFMLPKNGKDIPVLAELGLSLLLGGVIVPARVIAKAIQ